VVTPFGASGNYFEDQTTRTGREEWLSNAFLAPVHAYGSHQIQIGVDVERSGIDQTIDRHEYTTCALTVRSYATCSFLGSPEQFKKQRGGLRLCSRPMESSVESHAGRRIPHAMGRIYGRFSVRSAPVGGMVAEMVRRDEVAAGWGISTMPSRSNMLALSQAQDSIGTFYGPTGAGNAGSGRNPFILDPHDLRLPRFALSSFSAERSCIWGINGKMNLISREGSRGFTFEESLVNPTTNQYALANIQRQRIARPSLAFRRTFLSRYEWFASYTRSELALTP